MRALWNFVSFLAVVNLLALLIVLAWMWQSGRMTRERLHDIRDVLSMPERQASAAAARTVSEAESQRLREVEERRRAHPPSDSATQVQQIAFVQQQRDQAARRLDDERRMLAAQLQQATARMEANIAAFEQRRSSFHSSQQNDRQRKIDEQFLQAVKQLEQLPAKQAKGVLEQLLADKNVDQAVAYLDAMSPRAAAKVLREFKSGPDLVLATELLERLRTFGVDARDDHSPASESGAQADEVPPNGAPADADASAANSALGDARRAGAP
jgi:hypothetical protein